MQKVTGALTPGAHAGSYNGQDAYNDMLIVEKRDDTEVDNSIWGGETAQTLDASYYKGPGARNGKEREVLTVEDTEGGDAMNRVRRLTPL